MHSHLRSMVASLMLFGIVHGGHVFAQDRASASDADISRAVAKQIGGLDYGRQRPEVTVSGGVVRLSGTVATLWLKEQTISRVLKVPGVVSLMADLVIPKAESDAKLAAEVLDRIQKYDRLSPVFDDVEGGVRNGAVRLSGALTDDKKMSDILERVAKVRGVQAIDNKVTVLSASQGDERLRVAIANAIYRNPDFENYSRVNPPIRVIVNLGYVTLVGVVRSDVERIKAHEAAAMIPGILKLDDQVKLFGELKNAR